MVPVHGWLVWTGLLQRLQGFHISNWALPYRKATYKEAFTGDFLLQTDFVN